MLSIFFKTTLRNLWKHKTYSFLNVAGLAIGIACAALIFLWVEDEMNYDSTNEKKDRLYYVLENWPYETETKTFGSTPGPLAAAIKAEMTGVVNTSRTSETQTLLFATDDKSLYMNGKYADPSLFSMLTLPFVQGDPKNAFTKMHSIVLTEKSAIKFFGSDKSVVGKTIKVDNSQEYTVSGVLKDIPGNATLQFEWLAPFEVYYQKNKASLNEWGSNSINTYVELDASTNLHSINAKLEKFLQKIDPRTIVRPFLFSMNDWRLYDKFENGKQVGGRIEFVRLFSIIAWIILFIACVNFMNLATARSEKRAKEVGVKKTMGAERKWLAAQFMGEALLMAIISACGAMIIISLALPAFNVLVEKNLSIGFDTPLHVSALVFITLTCGVVAGSYPSLYLSSLSPITVLKGLKIKTGSASFIRKGLVITQFSISIVLIISTVIIYQQIQHVKNRDLGFNKENLIKMNVQGDMVKRFTSIKQDLFNTGLVENAALSSLSTLNYGDNGDGLSWHGKDPESKMLVSFRGVSPEFIATSRMKIIQGRDFQINPGADSLNVIITESLAKVMNIQNVVGEKLTYEGETKPYTIIGVVNDYVYGNMYGKPDPVMFYCSTEYINVMYIRLKGPNDMEQTLSKIESVMKRNNPGYPFDYNFVDVEFNQRFKNEMLTGKLSRIFAVLAIIISCFGLFGLAAYTAERRTKEIGVRKVLGASVAGITSLLSKDFLRLVVISAIVAFPIAWWAMNSWLQDYAYRITISWWVFLLAGVLAVITALITISFQAVKAAMANPVESLRTE